MPLAVAGLIREEAKLEGGLESFLRRRGRGIIVGADRGIVEFLRRKSRAWGWFLRPEAPIVRWRRRGSQGGGRRRGAQRRGGRDDVGQIPAHTSHLFLHLSRALGLGGEGGVTTGGCWRAEGCRQNGRGRMSSRASAADGGSDDERPLAVVPERAPERADRLRSTAMGQSVEYHSSTGQSRCRMPS